MAFAGDDLDHDIASWVSIPPLAASSVFKPAAEVDICEIK